MLHLGRKSGKGNFLYQTKSKNRDVNLGALEIYKKYKLVPKGAQSEEDIQLRMASRFINEAILCLQEGILNGPVSAVCCTAFGFNIYIIIIIFETKYVFVSLNVINNFHILKLK